jgi:transposase
VSSRKYIGMDVHQASISAAVRDADGKIVMEATIETRAAAILDFIGGLRGNLRVTFEEGTNSAWLYDLLTPHVEDVIVCDPRRNALLKVGNKNDRVDARKLSDLLRAGLLSPVYHGKAEVRTLREVARTYLTITKDLTRVMNRLKALYRSRAIGCAGQQVYSTRRRKLWLDQLTEPGLRRRAEWMYQQLDSLKQLHREVKKALLIESENHPAHRILRQIPRLGPIRVALLIALVQTPDRFRTKRQLWAYCGLALQTRTSAEYSFAGGELQRKNKLSAPRGLNVNHNHDLKNLFKGAATRAGRGTDPLSEFYEDLLARGIKPSMARLTMARKLAAIVLRIWKKGEDFDPARLKRQSA